MCCRIVARKSVAPAPRYVCGQDQEIWRKKILSKIIITPFPRPRPDFRECVTSMIFQELVVFFAWRAWRGVPNWKSHCDFFLSFKKSLFLKQHGDLWWTGKSFVSSKDITVNFSRNKRWNHQNVSSKCLFKMSYRNVSSPFNHFYILTFVHSYIPTFLHSFILSLLHSYIPIFLHSYNHAFLHCYIPTFLYS